uniref:BTB domain-containing protein n=1 Tax=viral metagenome TaxID=1070528 RepID=A0A6C0C8N0_9ZZZZ
MENNSTATLDFASDINVVLNDFKIIHLHNQSNTYHLTRQVLMDSALTQDTFSFFYHILLLDTDSFNEKYGSFACVIDRTSYEADLYLNVNSDALYHIINFIQTGKIDCMDIYLTRRKLVDEIFDLAIMFAIPTLVDNFRNIVPEFNI